MCDSLRVARAPSGLPIREPVRDSEMFNKDFLLSFFPRFPWSNWGTWSYLQCNGRGKTTTTKRKHQAPTLALVIQEGCVLDLGLGKEDNVHVRSHRVVFHMPAPTPPWPVWSFRERLLHLSRTLACAPLPALRLFQVRSLDLGLPASGVVFEGETFWDTEITTKAIQRGN